MYYMKYLLLLWQIFCEIHYFPLDPVNWSYRLLREATHCGKKEENIRMCSTHKIFYEEVEDCYTHLSKQAVDKDFCPWDKKIR